MSVCHLLTELLPEKTRARVRPSSAKQTSSSSGTQGEDCKQVGWNTDQFILSSGQLLITNSFFILNLALSIARRVVKVVISLLELLIAR